MGASGMIGKALIARNPKWRKLGLDEEVNIDLTSMDLSSPPDGGCHDGNVVIFCSAMSKPGDCERMPDLCNHINVSATGALIASWLARGIRIVFFSSDLVFDGREPLYPEDAPHSPVGVYGKSKAAIEQRFAGHPLFKVVRLSYVVSEMDSFTAQLIDHARSGRPFEVIDPLSRAAILIDDLLATVEALATRFDDIHHGVVNCAGPALVSRLDMARSFVGALGRPMELEVWHPGSEFYVGRPASIHLQAERIADVLGRPPATIGEAYATILARQAPPV
jgi:dTDP-4-dehydrorhamnose reductase